MSWKHFFGEDSISPPTGIRIFDTTLRDGEQTPGVALTPEAKLEIARALDELRVDIIEAGYPMVSRGEEDAVKRIASEGLTAEVCALSRIDKMDIDAAIRCDVDWIHIFVATSPIHLKYKLKMNGDEVLRRAVEAVEYAKAHGLVVHFSAEDATRTDPEFLIRVYRAVIESGADSIDIPDTTGIMTPERFWRLVIRVKEAVDVPIAVHCHNDFGLATANTLAGILAGAEIPHVTVNGLGERAGNASLEEVVAALKFLYKLPVGIDLEKISKVSRIVERLTGIQVQRNKAIVGDNAFTHESGIHVHGVLNRPETYEPIPPEAVGRRRRIMIGKHSGWHAIAEILRRHKLNLGKDEISEILREIKRRGDRGQIVTEETVVELALRKKQRRPIRIREVLTISSINGCSCTVSMEFKGRRVVAMGFSQNPIDAAIDAVRDALKRLLNIDLIDVRIMSRRMPPGFVSEAEVVVDLGNSTVEGYGFHENPAQAIAMAAINAAEKALREVTMYR